MQRTSSNRRWVATAGSLALLVAATGCGNRLTHDEIRSAAYGPAGEQAAGLTPPDPGAGAAGIDGLPDAGGDPASAGGTDAAATGVQTSGAQTTDGGVGGGTTSAGASSTGPVSGRGGGGPVAGTPSAGRSAPGASGGTGAGQPPGSAAAGSGGTGAGPAGTATAASPGDAPPLTSGSTASCTGSEPPITIGTVGNLSGLIGAALINGVKAIQAWVQSVNDRGGLNCHPVKYITVDDGSDPARNQALHRELVERRGVVAFLFEASPLGSPGSVQYLTEKQIPVIAEYGSADYMYDAPNFFPTASGGKEAAAITILAGSTVAIPAGLKKLAILTCNEITWCGYAGDIFAEYGTKLGFEVVSQGRTSLTQPDFTAQCLAAKNAGAQAFAVALAPEGQKRIASNCESVGFKPLKIIVQAQATLDMQDYAPMDNTVIAMPVAPWFLTGVPGVRDYQAQLARYNPDLPYEPVSIIGWQAAKAFELAMRTLPPGQVTSAGVLKAMSTLKDADLGGLSPRLSFAEGKPAARTACGWAVVLRNGDFASDGKLSCR